MMPLSMAKTGEANEIKKIGGKEDTRQLSGESWICHRRKVTCFGDQRQFDCK